MEKEKKRLQNFYYMYSSILVLGMLFCFTFSFSSWSKIDQIQTLPDAAEIIIKNLAFFLTGMTCTIWAVFLIGRAVILEKSLNSEPSEAK